MIANSETTTERHELPSLMEALDYKAPYLIEKLLKERITTTEADGEALFAEVIKFLILNQAYRDVEWSMFSRRIDEVWHEFVLFTVEYTAFCNRYFGGYQHHAPSNAPPVEGSRPRQAFVMEDFYNHYERLFGTPPPGLWHDSSYVTPDRRMIVVMPEDALKLVPDGEDMVSIVGPHGSLFSVSVLARPALEFTLRTLSFYVRELPGGLTAEEQVGLVETLMTQHILVFGA